MSTGGLIGGVVGAIGGFFLGGPVGALYGASVGFSIGMIIDPATPDVPSAGTPKIESVVMTSTVGDPIIDVLGTSEIVGHLLFYGKERTEEVPQQTQDSGGKGGGVSSAVATTDSSSGTYKYYMSWGLGLCAGPVDELYTIFKGEDVVWEGNLELPASGGEETIVLEDIGSCTFYFGTSDQVANTKVAEIIGDATLNPPLRNFCWVFMDDCFIGNYARTPTFKFVLRKTPELSFSSKNIIQTYDYNPAHAIYYILNNLSGLPTSWLNDSAFTTMASTLAGEYRGVSIMFANQQNAIQYLETINSHIDSILRYGTDGTFKPLLIRNDYDTSTVPELTEDAMLESPTFTRKSWIDTLNEIKVQYTELINVEREREISGTVYAVGDNQSGQLGDPAYSLGVSEYSLISGLSSILIKKAEMFSVVGVVVDTSNYLWFTGSNTYGQFGLGNEDDLSVFTKSAGPWSKIFPGSHMANIACLDDSGKMWCCGYNRVGQLGLDDASDPYPRHKSIFEQEALGLTWKHVALGMSNSAAVSADGRMYITGDNIYVMGYTNQDFYVWTEDLAKLTGWTEVVHDGGSFFGKRDGVWYACGYNTQGCLGVGNFTSSFNGWQSIANGHGADFTKIKIAHSGGGYGDGPNTAALKEDGTLWACGFNYNGQLGQGNTTTSNVFLQVGTASNWVDIAVGIQNMAAINSDGEIWGCGTPAWYGYGNFWGYRGSAVTLLTQETAKNKWVKLGGNYGAHGTFAIK